MTGAVLYFGPIALAALAGLAFGFGRYWESACLFACLWVPLANSTSRRFSFPRWQRH